MAAATSCCGTCAHYWAMSTARSPTSSRGCCGRLPEPQPVDPDRVPDPGLDLPPAGGLLEERLGRRPAGVGKPCFTRETRQERQQWGHGLAFVEHVGGQHEVERAPADERVGLRPVHCRG